MAQISFTDVVKNEMLKEAKLLTKVVLKYSGGSGMDYQTIAWTGGSTGEITQDGVVEFPIDVSTGNDEVVGFILCDDASNERLEYGSEQLYSYPNDGFFRLSGTKVRFE